MDKKQFYHQMDWDRFTAVCEVPTKEEVLKIITDTFYKEIEVDILCGYAFMNPSDLHYVKKVGRELSLSRLKNYKFTLGLIKGAVPEYKVIRFVPVDPKNSPLLYLDFELKTDRNKLYFFNTAINRDFKNNADATNE